MYAGRPKMKAAAAKYEAVSERLAGPMTRAQALRLKSLAADAYQPERYATDLSFDEAARRIDLLWCFQKRRNSFHFRRAGSVQLEHSTEKSTSHRKRDASSSVHCRACTQRARPLRPIDSLHHVARNLSPECPRYGCPR